jgi:tRNA(His) 5'-end guanylyltransferase
MKKYEDAYRFHLTDRLPLVIRVDGKSFHTYTAKLNRNDSYFISAMNNVALSLCAGIMGAKFAYVQSDEVSVLVDPWVTPNSQAWFSNNLNKIVSVSASIASSVMTAESASIFGVIKPACFDSRAFIIPPNEIINYFIWRQQDAVRNSVRTLGNMYYSNSELNCLSNNKLLSKLESEKGVIWDEQATRFKYGACAIPQSLTVLMENEPILRKKWVIDENIPHFVTNRDYIESLSK